MDQADTPDLRPLVLVVDDAPDNLALMVGLLKDHYRVKVAASGERALQLAAVQPRPDLVLLDVVMPGMDGHEVCRRLKIDERTTHIPVIFLTAQSDVEGEAAGFALGAEDYITKPVSPPILLARLRTHLALKAAADFLRDKSAFLEAEVARRTQEIEALQDVLVLALASLGETRDNETGNHLRRTQHYVRSLAEHLRRDPRHAQALTEAEIRLLFKSAPLHDIGKVGIPDRILLKPGALTPEEFEHMKAHTTLGRDALARAESALGRSIPFLRLAKEIALSHQEKWDGTGYPQGLRGPEIPLSARLMALADVYDALICERVYKSSMTHESARAIIVAGRGTHFDPEIVDAFLAREDEFRSIARRFAEDDEAAGGDQS